MEASAPDFGLAYELPMSMISVVEDRFCCPNPMEILVKKRYKGLLLNQHYKVQDYVNGNLLLQVDGSSISMNKKRVMHDASGSPILTMHQKTKLVTLRHEWRVHRRERSEQKDVIFSVKRSHPLDMKPRLDVFMASNTDQDIANFQLVGSHTEHTCRLYKGDTIIAEVMDVFPRSNYSKENFRIKINAGVDYAFIVALLVILTVNDYI